MTIEEYRNLKYGDLISQNERYYVVIDDNPYNEADVCEFIATEELTQIGVKTEFGVVHTNINYKFSEVVTDKTVIAAVKEWCRQCDDGHTYEPYSFIAGYCSNGKVVYEQYSFIAGKLKKKQL